MKVSTRSLVALAALVLGLSGASQWWAARHEAQIGEQVAALVKPGDIRMLSSTTCGICTAARRWFDANHVAHSECFIERDASCRAEFDALRAPGTPVLLLRGQPQLGFNLQRVLAALQSRG